MTDNILSLLRMSSCVRTLVFDANVVGLDVLHILSQVSDEAFVIAVTAAAVDLSHAL